MFVDVGDGDGCWFGHALTLGTKWVNNISLFVKGTPFLTFTDSAANQCLGRVQSVGTIYPTLLLQGKFSYVYL